MLLQKMALFHSFLWLSICIPCVWVRNWLVAQQTQVRSLGGKGLLEEVMATHCSILAWRIPWTEERCRLVHRVTKSWTHMKQLRTHSSRCMCHSCFIRSSVDGHLHCFHVLAIINSAAMNLGCIYLFKLWFSLDICPRVELLDYMVALFLVL